MKIIQDFDTFLKNDVTIITHEHVVNSLQKIANLLSNTVEKRFFATLSPQYIEYFWSDVSQIIQTCYLDCLHWRCDCRA